MIQFKVEHVRFLLLQTIVAHLVLSGRTIAGEDFENLDIHGELVTVDCVHDVTRFGKRICDCGYRNKDFAVPRFDGSTTEIELINCKSLLIQPDTFVELFGLSRLSIINVENLILEPNALNFARNNPSAQLKINLINNLIEELPSNLISGPIHEIAFVRCRIGVFRPFSVASIGDRLENLRVVETFVNRIERHAFKRFNVNYILIEGSKFVSPIVSQSFYEIDVQERFDLRNSSFYHLLPSAFTMKNVTHLQIQNSEFEKMDGESLNLQIRKSIRITGNYFNSIHEAAFIAIALDSSYFSRNSQKPALQFVNNRIGQLDQSNALRFSDSFNVQIEGVHIAHSISCNDVITLEQSSLFKNHPNEIFFSTSGAKDEFKSFNDIRRVQCLENNFWMWLIIGVIVGAIILVIICSIVSWYCLAQKRKKLRALEVVMPEPRTYRETQIVMQIENHGLLKTDL
uniref:Uncharacterized protein n=1 Tax=Culex tarsalis TaxID=7177 RepID=A0A1Q3FJE0_CULTA